jgi:Double zinc ribbon
VGSVRYTFPAMPPATPSTVTCPRCSAQASGHFCANCGAPLAGALCAGCGSVLTPGAKFCHRCGTAVGAAPARPVQGGLSAALPWAVAAIALVALVALVAGQHFNASRLASAPVAPDSQQGAPAQPESEQGASEAPARAPDISALSPRERADRLYDRIMRLDSEGKRDSVQFFAPMAISAYRMLSEQDADTRYDMGRIAEVAGATPVARAEADSILKTNPTHLLGLILAMRTAKLSGDQKGAELYARRLLAAEAAERRKGLPEYQRHARDIDAALGEAKR